MRRFLAGTILTAALAASAGIARADVDQPPYGHTIYGVVKQVRGNQATVKRNGRTFVIDIAIAHLANRMGVLYPNKIVAAHGDYDAAGIFHAVSITSADGLRNVPESRWPQDQ
jgi:hypothetical protein